MRTAAHLPHVAAAAFVQMPLRHWLGPSQAPSAARVPLEHSAGNSPHAAVAVFVAQAGSTPGYTGAVVVVVGVPDVVSVTHASTDAYWAANEFGAHVFCLSQPAFAASLAGSPPEEELELVVLPPPSPPPEELDEEVEVAPGASSSPQAAVTAHREREAKPRTIAVA